MMESFQTVDNLEKSTYYIRPFVTNQDGDFYGSQITVSTFKQTLHFEYCFSTIY